MIPFSWNSQCVRWLHRQRLFDRRAVDTFCFERLVRQMFERRSMILQQLLRPLILFRSDSLHLVVDKLKGRRTGRGGCIGGG